jgi:hypothetical protein
MILICSFNQLYTDKNINVEGYRVIIRFFKLFTLICIKNYFQNNISLLQNSVIRIFTFICIQNYFQTTFSPSDMINGTNIMLTLYLFFNPAEWLYKEQLKWLINVLLPGMLPFISHLKCQFFSCFQTTQLTGTLWYVIKNTSIIQI